MPWAPARQPHASQMTPKLWGAEASYTPCAECSTDTGQTPLDLLLWQLLNFSISCCRETFCKKWLRNTQRKFTSTEASSHHLSLANPLHVDVTQAGTTLPQTQRLAPPALPGGHNTKHWLHQTGQTKLLSRQHSAQQGTHPMCSHRSRKPGPPPPHTVCPVMSELLTAPLCKSNFHGVVTPMRVPCTG